MTATPEEKMILLLLAKEWDKNGPPGILDISDIVTALPTSSGRIPAALKNLFTRGLVDMNRLKTSAFLTPEGYDAAKDHQS